MELIERTQKSSTTREQKADQKNFLTQINVLQHSWKLSFHASNTLIFFYKHTSETTLR